MALKLIGAGLGRTGTLSLKLALEHIGRGRRKDRGSKRQARLDLLGQHRRAEVSHEHWSV